MKVFALIAAFAVTAWCTSVCIPPTNEVAVQQWSNGNMQYGIAIQLLDVSMNAARNTDQQMYNNHGHNQEMDLDVLILASTPATYITRGVPGNPHSFRCEVSHEKVTVTDPCLTHNGTKVQQVTVGETVTDDFFGQDDHHGVQQYSRILITPAGIPVHATFWTTGSHYEMLFENFNATVPADGFTIPTICQHATPMKTPLSQRLGRERHGFMRFVKLE